MCQQHEDGSFPGRKTEAEGDAEQKGPGKGLHCPLSQLWHQVDKFVPAGAILDSISGRMLHFLQPRALSL